MRIRYCVADKCFYICDKLVIKSLYSAFLSHKEQFVFQVHALRITIKLDFWGTLGECVGYSLVKSGSFSFRVSAFRYKADN